MKTVICYSLDYEIRFLKDKMNLFKNIDFVKIGVGKKRTLKNVEKILDKYDKFILIGFAGSVCDEFSVGDIFSFNKICLLDNLNNNILGEEFLLDNKKDEGKALCAVSKVLSKKEKYVLSEQYSFIDAIDMESYFFAKTVLSKNKECKIIKVISDNKDFVMPDFLMIKKYFNRFKYRFLLEIFVHPIDFFRLIRLRWSCFYAAKRLGDELGKEVL